MSLFLLLLKIHQECPIDCKMGQWNNWSACSETCVDIFQGVNIFPKRFRTREIVQKSNGLGQSCEEFKSKEIEPCSMFPCPVNGKWRQWSEFGPCSVSCGNGTKSRTRTCNGPFYGGQSCPDEQSNQC